MVAMEQESIFTSQCPLGGLVLLKDGLEADGNFLIPYTLKQALSDGCKVLMVCLANTMSNYQYMLRKLGINLAACMESRHVAAVEALAHQCLADVLSAEDAMKQLEGKLAEAVRGLQCDASTRLCIIFDSFSALRELCRSEAQWRTFVHRCSSPGSLQQGARCVVMRVHSDVEEASPWQLYLEHSAQVVIQVVCSDSGQSSDVNGQLMVKQRLPGLDRSASRVASEGGMRMQHTRFLNYKVAENGVHLNSRSTALRP